MTVIWTLQIIVHFNRFIVNLYEAFFAIINRIYANSLIVNLSSTAVIHRNFRKINNYIHISKLQQSYNERPIL